MQGRARDVFFWLHLVIGVATSLVTVVLCVTGALLALELPATRWADRAQVEVPAQHAELPSIEALVRDAMALREGEAPVQVRVGAHPSDPAEASWGRRDRVQLNPWSARPLGDGAQAVHGFFRTVMFVHRWFALEGAGRDVARVVTGTTSLLLVVLVPSGLLLWLPKRWSLGKLRSITVPRRLPYGQGLEYQWHHAFGFWMALPLLFLAFTGAGIGFHWLNDGLVWAAGGAGQQGPRGAHEQAVEPASLDRRLEGLDEALALVAQDASDWASITLAVPHDEGTVTFTVDRGNGRQLQHREEVEVSRHPLAITSRAPAWRAAGREGQVRNLVRFGHTGEMFGVLGMLLAAVASLVGAFLAYSGLALSVRRFLHWRARRARQGRG